MRQLFKIYRGIISHPLASTRKWYAFSRFLKWQIGQVFLPYPVVYTFVDDSKLVVKKGMTGATGNLYVGLLEFQEMGFILHVLNKEDLFGDIGANVGVYSILASVNAGAKSITVEPIPVTYNHLNANVKINNAEDLILTIQAGVGDEESMLRFTKNNDTTNSVALNQLEDDGNTVLVPVKKMDDIFNTATPSVLKIDVEGFEWQVLHGGQRILSDNALKAIIIEINGSGEAYGISNDAIHSFLTGYNFAPYSYNPFHRRFIKQDTYGDDNTIYIRDLDWAESRVAAAPAYNVFGVKL